MKKIPIQSLEEGMIFTEPVYIDGNNLLVPVGIPVRKKDLDRLTAWGIDTVETEGEPVTPAGEGEVAEMLPEGPDPVEESAAGLPEGFSLSEVQNNTRAYRNYIDIIEKLDLSYLPIGAGLTVDIHDIDVIVASLQQAVRNSRDQVVGYILGGEVSGHTLAKNSVNTAILSALIAAEMRLSPYKVLQLITGALLHDVGMLRLPPEIREKRGGLSSVELQKIKTHPVLGYRIISKELSYPDDVAIIALQHHERWDGGGYPQGTSGEDINICARIVSITDAFEAMVSEKSYRNSMIGYHAMKNLLSDNGRRFAPDVLKAFCMIMGIYPIGSIVLLNNGSAARVVEVRKDAPLRPKIKILTDERGTVLKQDEGALVDLLMEKTLFIAKAIDPKEFFK